MEVNNTKRKLERYVCSKVEFIIIIRPCYPLGDIGRQNRIRLVSLC